LRKNNPAYAGHAEHQECKTGGGAQGFRRRSFDSVPANWPSEKTNAC
jgi:hypothetical protein